MFCLLGGESNNSFSKASAAELVRSRSVGVTDTELAGEDTDVGGVWLERTGCTGTLLLRLVGARHLGDPWDIEEDEVRGKSSEANSLLV